MLTIGELRIGVHHLRLRDRERAAVLDRWIDGFVNEYRDRLVGLDLDVVERWALINSPNRLPAVDGLLAATAIVRGWTLVTRNVKEVASAGVRLLKPFNDRDPLGAS